MGDRVITDNREDAALIWENHYDPDTALNSYDITIFNRVSEDGDEELYERISESHIQRGYDTDTVKRLIEEAGMEFVTVYDAMTHEKPGENSERVYYIAREKKQDGKYYGR